MSKYGPKLRTSEPRTKSPGSYIKIFFHKQIDFSSRPSVTKEILEN